MNMNTKAAGESLSLRTSSIDGVQGRRFTEVASLPRFGIIALLIAPEAAFCGELWSWHAFDTKLLKTSRVELTVHSRFRTRRDFGNLQQGRAGGVAKVQTFKPITAIGGYYYGKEEDSAEDWRNFHRVFAGAEVPIYRLGAVRVATRGLIERFLVVERPGFSRYRHRIRMETSRALGPYVASEWFFDAGGWLSGRYAAGLRWRSNDWSSIEVGYLYDQRRPSVGEPRHVIVTQFTIERLRHE